MYSTTRNYGFTTCIRLQFRSTLDVDRAERVGASVQVFLNAHAADVLNLAGVTVRQTPSVTIKGSIGSLPLELQTDRDLPFPEKLRLAQDVVDFARANVTFSDIAEVIDDGTPPVATVGF